MRSGGKLNLAVLASGNGSNLQALINECEAGRIDARVAIVISDNPDAKALQRARKHSIQAVALERKNFSLKEEFDSALADAAEEAKADLVCLAGFMRLVSPLFIDRFNGWVINIHPALLPSFPGLKAQKQALDYGVRISGCTVHFVDEGVDTGPIILQSAVEVSPDDTVETLSARILKQEHLLYPKAIQLIAKGAVKPGSGAKAISPQ
ncbi:Phosphoribosylglycinamide formyltransferase [hydrothermal vent metagenome]|uniref:phosphoribosylglycinamide formyltransferase 1 n=1 Tax=hydrothermal vent metagenome TaxID=652676 RepID=A0A3B1BUY3_9ZZZZ